jgi:ParB-like chromosome segregation protein Spo0J
MGGGNGKYIAPAKLVLYTKVRDEMNIQKEIIDQSKNVFKKLKDLSETERIQAINQIRLGLSEYSLFSDEPVDCVQWVLAGEVTANDYNPNSVAPPEMELLELSVLADGFTQPIVSWKVDGFYEVIDGFHRNRVGRECEKVQERIKGYLPVVVVNNDRVDRGDRIASTIRHNRARGKHRVTAMSEIVVELKKRNWSDKKIGKDLGMDEDEVLRLCQISGLENIFQDKEFSEAWEVGDAEEELIEEAIDEEDIPPLLEVGRSKT